MSPRAGEILAHSLLSSQVATRAVPRHRSFHYSTNGIIQGGEHEGVGTGASAGLPTLSGEIDSPVPWPIAREELITAAANVTAAAATIANDVVRLIETFISLCRCPVESKQR